MPNEIPQSPTHHPSPLDQASAEPHGYVRVPRRDRGTEEIPRTTLCDRRLSYRARGVLGRLLANPDGYAMTSEDLAIQGREGRDAVRTALRELEDTGYIARIKHQGGDGKWTTTSLVYDVPTVARLDRPGDGGTPVRPIGPDFPRAPGAPSNGVEPASPGGSGTGSTEDGFSGPGTEDGFPVVGFSGPGETEDGFSGAKSSKSKSKGKIKIKSESTCARGGARATPPGSTAWLPGVGDPDEARADLTADDRPEHQNGHQDARHDEPDKPVGNRRQAHQRSEGSRGTRLPENWQPDEVLLAWAAQKCPAVNAATEAEKFLDYWTALPGAKGRKTNWAATWRNWIRRTDEQQKARQSQSGGKSKTLQAIEALSEAFPDVHHDFDDTTECQNESADDWLRRTVGTGRQQARGVRGPANSGKSATLLMLEELSAAYPDPDEEPEDQAESPDRNVDCHVRHTDEPQQTAAALKPAGGGQTGGGQNKDLIVLDGVRAAAPGGAEDLDDPAQSPNTDADEDFEELRVAHMCAEYAKCGYEYFHYMRGGVPSYCSDY